MTVATVRIGPDDFDWETAGGSAAGVREVVARASETDGRSPLNEAALLRLRHSGLRGASLWLTGPATGRTVPGAAPTTGFALVAGDPDAAEVEADLVVDPAARGVGLGAALATEVLAGFPAATVSAWSHGNHPAAAVLASRTGFVRARDLWMMRRPLPLAPATGCSPAADSFRLRAFVLGQDEEAFLAVNAAAFADHPDQGGMTREDLDQRMAEPWFDPAGFLLAESPEGKVLGFHWTKVHPGEGDAQPAHGEVYVLGVSPGAQGSGLGKRLTLAGLRHLGERGLGEVVLYVESDNAPAVAVYQRLGFTHAAADTDVRYTRPPG